jgi:hypothetical protein
VRVNTTAADGGIGESSYTRNIHNHSESSDHAATLLSSLNIDDIIEVYVQRTALARTVAMSPVASMYVEYIGPERTVFRQLQHRRPQVQISTQQSLPLFYGKRL